MSDIKQQWKKRVEIFRFVFSILMTDINDPSKITQQAFENNLFDKEQLQIIEYFANHLPEIINIISTNLATGWTWERIPQVDKAVLITAYAESKTTNLERKIIIDQALITIKHFADPNSVKYVNAILDKIIK